MDSQEIIRLREERDRRELAEYGRLLTFEERKDLIDASRRKEEEEALEKEKAERLFALKRNWLASVPPRYKDASFDSYICVTQKQKEVVEFLKEGKSAVLYGPNGTGKTHLAFACCRHAIEQGVTASYMLAFDLFNMIKKSFSDGTTDDVLSELRRCQLLVIDEMDKSLGTPMEYAYLNSLINSRYNYLLSTVIVTNATLDELVSIIGMSALDRIASEGKVIELSGENHRKKNKGAVHALADSEESVTMTKGDNKKEKKHDN